MKALGDRRVTVTGGAGFLGSYVVEALRRRGCTPFVPRRADYDLTKRDAVRRLYADARPALVIHLAAVVGGIGANLASPATLFHDNLVMGVQLLDEAHRAGIEKFVAIGTVCAYPKHTPVPFREEALWDGYPEETNAPYGLAKKMLLVQSQAYRQQHGYNSIFLLPVNLYGPRDNFDEQTSHVIPALIKKVLDAKEANAPSITCWGDGSPTREFLHAADAAEGIVRAAERYDSSEPINLGTGEEHSIREIAEQIASRCNYAGRIEWDTSKPNGQPRRCLDTSKARERFGFTAQIPFERGLRETIEWYRAARRGPVR